MEMRRASIERERELAGDHRGGGGASGHRHHGGIIRLPEPLEPSGFLRGPEVKNAWRDNAGHGQEGPFESREARRPPGGDQHRYLYDPKTNIAPTSGAAHSRGGLPGNNGEPGGGSSSRFPMDGRFIGAPAPSAPGSQMSIRYRAPFPTGGGLSMPHHQSASTMRPPGSLMTKLPLWYDVRNPHQYPRNSKHDVQVVTFIAQNDHRLRRIMLDGGPQLVCRLWVKDVAECRKNIRQAFEHLLKTDLLFCAEHDVEFHIWKIVFYNILETLKEGLRENSPDVRKIVRDNIGQLLEEGMDFYAKMLDVLDNTYTLDLDVYYDVLEPRPTDKYLTCALMSAQKCLLCLGDLARYKEGVEETNNYGKARMHYQKASNIEPNNGRPYNQLAILAVTTKRKFEAVYYNMRCLQSRSPFPSSHDALTVIFEEIRKKWDANEVARGQDRRLQQQPSQQQHQQQQQRLRREIWIRAEGGRRLHRTTSAAGAADADADADPEDTELRAMSAIDLNKRFNNTFLYVVGKLYTHINMESFLPTLEVLLREFRHLVSRSPLPIDSKRLVQIMSLNMFVVEHARVKSSTADNTSVNSALKLAFDAFGVLVERCNALLTGFRPVVDTTSQCIFEEEEDLPTLLAAVKVWCDWLVGNNETWSAAANAAAGPFEQLARLATHLESLKTVLRPVLRQLLAEDEVARRPDRATGYELVKLGEDALLCGFAPWLRGLEWSVYRRWAPRSVPTALAQDARRLDAINFAVDFLEGLDPPILKWSPPDASHVSLLRPQQHAKVKPRQDNSSWLVPPDVVDESYSDDEPYQPSQPNEEHDDEISRLRRRRDELERRRAEEERQRRRALAERVSVTVEIRPRHVVPDTNCFISFLAELKSLASAAPPRVQLRVPLVVVAELEGLAKGGRTTEYPSREHAARVEENAKAALKFLRDRPPASVRCITSKVS